jgi:uncharacterized protein
LYSAAVSLIRYPQARVVFINYSAESFARVKGTIESEIGGSQEGGIFIISDIGLGADDNLIEALRECFILARSNNWSVYWFDHHPWPRNAVDGIAPLIELVLDKTGAKCTTELIHEKFLFGDPVAALLASIANTMDYFKKDQYLTPVSELIRYYRNFPDHQDRLFDLAKKSSRGTLWDVDMQREYKVYSRIHEAAKKQAFKTIRINDINSVKVAFVQSSPFIQNSLFSEEVFNKTGVDLVMLYSSDGRVSIRRNNDKISCSDIASALPCGGGHAFAAGGTFRSDPNDVESILSELQEAVLMTIHKTDAVSNR